jgi:hypothetical protein
VPDARSGIRPVISPDKLQRRTRTLVIVLLSVLPLVAVALFVFHAGTTHGAAGKPPGTKRTAGASLPPSPTASSSSHASVSSGPGPDGRFPVTLNLTGLSFTQAYIDRHLVTNGIDPTEQTLQVRLGPGSHYLQFPGGATGAWAATFPFQVTSTGSVLYDRQYDGVLTGFGTSTLRAISRTVTVDVTGTSYSWFAISFCGANAHGAKMQQFRLVPGNYNLNLQTDPSSNALIPFRVTSAGTVSYDGSLLTGYGTSTLGIAAKAAKTITIDATSSHSSKFELNAATGWQAASTPQQFRLLPGTYVLMLPTTVLQFTITSSGTVSYNPSQHPGWLTGTGTPTLHLTH